MEAALDGGGPALRNVGVVGRTPVMAELVGDYLIHLAGKEPTSLGISAGGEAGVEVKRVPVPEVLRGADSARGIGARRAQVSPPEHTIFEEDVREEVGQAEFLVVVLAAEGCH